MTRSILENPKISQRSFAAGQKEGLITDRWRKRVAKFFRSLIPSYIGEEKQIWLCNLSEIVEFEEKLKNGEKDFSSVEYVCIAEAIVDIYDIVAFLELLRKRMPIDVRLFFSNFNWLWSIPFKIAGVMGISRNRLMSTYYRNADIDCFLNMSGWELVKQIRGYAFPVKIPLLGFLFDNILMKMPFFRNFSLNSFFIARISAEQDHEEQTVSVLIPCKNEEDNIEAAVTRMPEFSKKLELVFIDDQSTDTTAEKIEMYREKFPEKNIVQVKGQGKGKGEAIRTGMTKASGDICMILDADLTVIPEDLPQFYQAMKLRRADFVHGTRLVYPLENDSMRFANMLGNVFFSILFSYILDQRTSDTLCGTKVFRRKDWQKFEEIRGLLKNSDLWGDYNLIFGASHYGLKVSQLPVRYFERLEGLTKMNKRIRNALIMLRVSWHALWKIKFVG